MIGQFAASIQPPILPDSDGPNAPLPADNGTAAADAQVPATPAFSPLYQQIKALILQSLQAGEWKPGEAIPSEMDLAARFRVSQGTVRKAIDELAAENLVVRRQGKGTFVATHAEQHVQYRFLKLMPDSGDRDSEGPAAAPVLECRRVRATAEVARSLALRSGDAVVQVRRVAVLRGRAHHPGRPLAARQRLQGPDGRADGRLPRARRTRMFEIEFGVRMVRAEEKIRAVAADEQQAALLESRAAGTPLLSVERVAYTYNDVPMELRRGLYRTDTHHYRNELS